MIDERFVFLGIAIGFTGSLFYIISTLKGETQPNRVSWFVWALAPLIAFFAEMSKGVGVQAWMTFAVGFSPLLVFIASFINKKAYWRLTRFDLICGAFALVGLALWGITREGNIAIAFSILADGLAAAPTLIKSWKFPETENHWVFTLSIINAGITMLTIKIWDFQHYGFPIYIFLVCSVLSLLIWRKIGKRVSAYFAKQSS